MQPHAHHLRETGFSFRVKAVEAVLEELEELLAVGEPGGGDKAHVIGTERVGDNQLRSVGVQPPVGQVVVIGVRDVVEAAFLGDEIDGVDRGAAGVPAARPLAGCQRVQADGFGDLPAFDISRHVAVLDPFVAVRGDLPVRILHRRDLRRRAGERGGDAVDGERDPRLGEQPVQPPEPGARPVLVHRFDIPVPLARPGGGTDHIGEKGLRGGIAVQDVVLPTFLVVEYELHGDAGAAGPVGERRFGAVAQHVARVAGHRWASGGQLLSPAGAASTSAADFDRTAKNRFPTPWNATRYCR